jgi:serine/threonine protein kinase
MELLHDADLSNSHIQLPHASFWIEGPNGRHLCLVLPVLGPSISEAAKEDVAFQKDILFKAAESLQFLHDRGICHGDFRPANILLLIPSLQGMERNAMRKLLGKSETEPVIVLDEKASHRVPRRWVEKKQIRARPFNRIAVIDFGVHFQISKPLNQAFIPRQYVSPEAWLGLEIGPSMDLWSFACTILEVRNTGGGFGGERYEDIAGNLELYLGPMPEPYRSIYMKRISEDPPKWYTPGEDGPVSSTLEDLEESRAKSLKYWGGHNELFEACIGSVRQVWEYPLDAEGCEDLSQEPTMVEYKVPDDEVPVLADLVRRSFKWHVSERLDLAGMMNHEWFDGRQSKELAKKTKNLGAAEPLVRWFRKHATTLAMSAVLTGLFLGFSIWKGAPGARSSRMSAFRGLLHGLTRWKL